MFKGGGGGEIFCRCRLYLHKSFYFSVITHFLVIAAHKFFLVLVLKHGHVLFDRQCFKAREVEGELRRDFLFYLYVWWHWSVSCLDTFVTLE